MHYGTNKVYVISSCPDITARLPEAGVLDRFDPGIVDIYAFYDQRNAFDISHRNAKCDQ